MANKVHWEASNQQLATTMRTIHRNLFGVSFLVASIFLHAVDSRAMPKDSPDNGAERRLRLYQTHTGERIEVTFRHGDPYLPDATAKLDYVLRDYRTGDVA